MIKTYWEIYVLNLGIDFKLSKLFWKVPGVNDDRGIHKVITDDDAKKIGKIVPITTKRLVIVFVISNKENEVTDDDAKKIGEIVLIITKILAIVFVISNKEDEDEDDDENKDDNVIQDEIKDEGLT